MEKIKKIKTTAELKLSGQPVGYSENLQNKLYALYALLRWNRFLAGKIGYLFM